MDKPLFYSVTEATKLLGVGKTLLYDQINAGAFPAVRIGRRTLVSRLYLEKLATPLDTRLRGERSDGAKKGEK